MLYQPNFCCNCGEKVERLEWHLWTNRRFCQLCETEYGYEDTLKKVFSGIFLMIGLVGVFSYFQSSEKNLDISQAEQKTIPMQISEEKIAQPRSLKSSVTETKRTNEPTENVQQDVSTQKNSKPLIVSQTSEKIGGSQKNSAETVYFCGAETKKGTPCSRKVKGGGRCWQHKGREAMLPEKDLLAEQN